LNRRPSGLPHTNHAGNLPSSPFYPVFHGDRINEYHTTLPEKAKAKEAAK
jgi:hypothetical protein